MKKRWSIVTVLFIPLFLLNPHTPLADQSTTNNRSAEEAYLGFHGILGRLDAQDSLPSGFKMHVVDALFPAVDEVCVADMDGDGDVDLLGAGSYVNDIIWWENLDVGSGSFYRHTIDSNFYWADKVVAIDLDGDGDMDVLSGSYQASQIAWWENSKPGPFVKHIIDSNYSSSVSVQGVDMDHDGDIDVIGASKSAGTVVWWENDGSEKFTKKIIDGYFQGVARVYAADINKDGDMDVVGVNGSQVAWWENNGSQKFTRHIIGSDMNFGYCVLASDIDADGDIDVLCADLYGNSIVWWENNGSQSFTKRVVDAAINTPYSICVADLNHDGAMDIVAVSGTDGYLCWYENTGSKSFVKHILSSNLGLLRSVRAGDLDNDGDIDIVCCGYWWENMQLTKPNRLLPQISVRPDSLYFYVGPSGSGLNPGSSTWRSFDRFRGALVMNGQSGNKDTAVVAIKNIGKATLCVQNMTSNKAWVTKIDTTSFLLKPEEELRVTLRCSAGDLFNGTYRGKLTIVSNDPATPSLDLPLLFEMEGGQEVNWVNEVEPNNSAAQAHRLSGPSPLGVKGSISVSDVGAIKVLGDDVEDLYVFTTQSNYLKIRLFDITADLDVFLMAIAGNTSTVWFSNNRGAAVDEKFVKTDLAPGTYYIGVSIYDPYPIQNSSFYSLTLEYGTVSGVETDHSVIPKEFALEQNYPNPFNPGTTIRYALPKAANVSLRIFNTLGQPIATLVDEHKELGYYQVHWNAIVSSGIYFYRLQAGEYVETKKMVVLR